MIRGRHQLVAAAITTLQTHLQLTIMQAARDFGWDTDDADVARLLTIKGWRQPSTREMFDPAIPLIVTTSSGWVGDPEIEGDGTVSAVYDLIVNPVVRGADFEQTADVISIVAAGVRTCLEQHRSLGVGWVSDLAVVSEFFDELEADKQRVLAEALITFHVAVCSIHDRNDRPDPDGGWTDAPTVLTTDVSLDHLEE